MAKIELISGGKRVNGVELTEQQFQAWKAAGSPNNVQAWLSGDSSQSTSDDQTESNTSDADTTNVPDASVPQVDPSALFESAEFQNLSEDQQQVVEQVYSFIAENNADQAERLAAAFKTAAQVADPFFAQQVKLAADTLERGFVSVDQEEEFKERQLKTRLSDLREDLETRKEFLSAEEQSQLKGIEREFEQNLKQTRQNLAAKGKTFSTQRQETEELLEETTGDLRESTKRRFGAQQLEADRQLSRAERDTQSEVERLGEIFGDKRTDLFREAERTLGTKGLSGLDVGGSLTDSVDPIGGITGEIPRKKTEDIISGAQSLIF